MTGYTRALPEFMISPKDLGKTKIVRNTLFRSKSYSRDGLFQMHGEIFGINCGIRALERIVRATGG